MSQNWTDKELLGYCEIHCKTERALFHADHVNRVIALAGMCDQFLPVVGWVSVHGEMQELVDLARARLSKRFRAYWSNDFHKSGTETLGADFFSEEHCYTAEDVAAIAALEVGQVWQAPHYGDSHTVTRIA